MNLGVLSSNGENVIVSEMKEKIKKFESEENCTAIKNKILEMLLTKISNNAEIGISITYVQKHTLLDQCDFPKGKYDDIIYSVINYLTERGFYAKYQKDNMADIFDSIIISLDPLEEESDNTTPNSIFRKMLKIITGQKE